jgi:hypothetical protein
MRVGGEFCQVSIFAKLVCQTVGGQFFLFYQNYMDDKLVCQTVGVCSYKLSYGQFATDVRMQMIPDRIWRNDCNTKVGRCGTCQPD